MPRNKPQAKHLNKARNCRKSVQRKALNENRLPRNIQIDYIVKNLGELCDDDVEEVISHINDLNKHNSTTKKKRTELVRHINSLPDSQIENAHSLLKTMVYPKGKNFGEILSP